VERLRRKTVAITGAGSGIGRSLAKRLSQLECGLALADIDEAGLRETAGMLAAGTRCTTHRVDVADRDAIYQFAADTVAAHGAVDAIVNNAGVALAGTVEEISDENLEWIVGINFWGVVHGTRAFLPHLKQRPRAHVVNLSSIFGIVSAPRMSAYNATKFAVRGFTESLRQDLKGTSVVATCVHPGGIATHIARNARVDGSRSERRAHFATQFEKNLVTSPDDAAERIVRGMARGEARVLIGNDAILGDLLARALPSAYDWLVGRLVRGLD
jgi:short-subunit dehydrogenase